MEYRAHPGRLLRHAVVFPFIWLILIPLLFLDIFVELYHRISFPLYGIPYVLRSSYIKIDRHKLSYLGIFDKVSCLYCSYANGFLNYAAAIAGETERYWCGIKHKPAPGFHEPAHQKNFAKYGDEKDLEKHYPRG